MLGSGWLLSGTQTTYRVEVREFESLLFTSGVTANYSAGLMWWSADKKYWLIEACSKYRCGWALCRRILLIRKLAASWALWQCFCLPIPSHCSQIALFPRSSHLTSLGCTLIHIDTQKTVLWHCFLCWMDDFFFWDKLTNSGRIQRGNRPASLHPFLLVRWSHYSIFTTCISWARWSPWLEECYV